MQGSCVCAADPCPSFAAPICLDDSDCDSAATLLNPGGYWACVVHATTRPGPWHLVGLVACESDGEQACDDIQAMLRQRFNAKLLEEHNFRPECVDTAVRLRTPGGSGLLF